MDYLIRLVQMHEDFRLAEMRSLASFFSIKIEILLYSIQSPFLILRILSYPTKSFSSVGFAAEALISRCVLAWGIYELWGMTGEDDASYSALHVDIKLRTGPELWAHYRESTFKFSIDAYCGKRSPKEQQDIINKFSYLGFEGPIQMQSPDVEFTVFEEWSLRDNPNHQRKIAPELASQTFHQHPNGNSINTPNRTPHRLFFGRLIKPSPRGPLTQKHSLKTRPYISTTSMDATLALITANLAHAGPGKLIYDPFVGTGGFLVAAAEFGAYVWGSDIDGRSFRGAGGKREGSGRGCEEGVGRNFKTYGLERLFGDCFVSDLTQSPLRLQNSYERGRGGWLDAIICDPPYGVREGLKVLGNREPRLDRSALVIDGVPAHTLPGYVAPKKPYSFQRMLDDILAFAAEMLVVDGRLAFWMPSANEDDEILEIPQLWGLELVECCVQRFNRWSRRLLVYRRREGEVGVVNRDSSGSKEKKDTVSGKTASDLNSFRKKYFQGFQS